MKKILITLFIGMFVFSSVHAQTVAVGGYRRAGTKKQIKAMQVDKLRDSLGITEDQAKNVDAIQQNYMLKMRAVKMDTQISEEERKSKLSTLQDERKADLKQVISEAQLAKLDNQRPKIKKAIHKKNTSQGAEKSKKYTSKKRQS